MVAVAIIRAVALLHLAAAAAALASKPRARRTALAAASLGAATTDDERKKVERRLRSYAGRMPRRHEEVAGITGGLGLVGELRRRARRRGEEGWSRLKSRRRGRRRRALARRFKKFMSMDDDSSMPREGGEGDDSPEEEENFDDLGLDAMVARAGVLRTRIRLRTDTLKKLEALTRDVELEIQRTGRMNERELAAVNEKWSAQKVNGDQINGERNEQKVNGEEAREGEGGAGSDGKKGTGGLQLDRMGGMQLDSMKRRSHGLENSILQDRIRLQRLERRILCFESGELGILERAVGGTLYTLNDLEFLETPAAAVQRTARKFVSTLSESTSVLLRKLDRVSSRRGPNNRDYGSVTDFVVQETAAGVRIVGGLLRNPAQLSQLVDPETPTLVPHVPAILARLDRLESHVAPILSGVLNNKRHLRTIEPYLDEVLERFDDIEPHLPWILDHIDTLAPYTGLLLKHIDELLLYAEVDEYEGGDGGNYAFAEQLLPYLEVYVSQLDLVGPHLPLLRPHLPLLLKHNRIKVLSPHVGVLFAKGYKDLSASANMDILLFYFGWALRIPLVPRMFFSFPGSPGMVSFLANRLPKRLVRGQCCDVTCYVDGDYGKGWNELSK